jgi:hypothetical protein
LQAEAAELLIAVVGAVPADLEQVLRPLLQVLHILLLLVAGVLQGRQLRFPDKMAAKEMIHQ